jgi:hypothetical protein
MVTSGKMHFFSLLLFAILTAFLIGANPYGGALDETVALVGPFIDETTGALTVAVKVKPGVGQVRNAQNVITRGLDMLSEVESGENRKVLLVTPGHYVFSRPVIYRPHHAGIDLTGEPSLTRQLTETPIDPNTIRHEIEQLRPGLPVIDGDGVTSFLVIDGVTSGVHLSPEVTGFYFMDHMAGLGGNHYPDLSYRLEDAQFTENGGYYTRYLYNDGGVVSVLGNSSVTFEHNIIEGAMALQCGGVLRNEQYGAPGSTKASVVAYNIAINPFAWHTGTFVDNNSGSYIRVLNNQILMDQPIPHEIDLIANFDDAFMVAENNRIIDMRSDKRLAIVGFRLISRQPGIVLNDNLFEGVVVPDFHNTEGSPPFPPSRSFYFLINKGKIWKLIRNIAFDQKLPMIRPGHWPDHMDKLVRTRDLDDNNPLRIAALKIYFNRYNPEPPVRKG